MWCWHRIKENENGLCPACRNAYGDDPHEFSAIDVTEVVKEEKEKKAREKQERDKTRQMQAYNSNASYLGDQDSGLGTSGRPADPPADRNQLANMRVIRRNLVYAVGLPPASSSENSLRSPSHFGQYERAIAERSECRGKRAIGEEGSLSEA